MPASQRQSARITHVIERRHGEFKRQQGRERM
jgi:hypothetical protein